MNYALFLSFSLSNWALNPCRARLSGIILRPFPFRFHRKETVAPIEKNVICPIEIHHFEAKVISKELSYIISDSVISQRESYLIFSFLVSTAAWINNSNLCVYLALEAPYIRQRKPLVRFFWPVPQRQTVRRSFELRAKLPKHRPCFMIYTKTRLLMSILVFRSGTSKPDPLPFPPLMRYITANHGGTDCPCNKTVLVLRTDIVRSHVGHPSVFTFSAALCIFSFLLLPLLLLLLEYPPSSY